MAAQNDHLRRWPVSKRVKSGRGDDGPILIEPVEDDVVVALYVIAVFLTFCGSRNLAQAKRALKTHGKSGAAPVIFALHLVPLGASLNPGVFSAR